MQRSARRGSVFFYDLNPRIKHSGDISKYFQIRDCLHPDYWIVKSSTMSEVEFQKVKKLFKSILLDRGDIFLSRDLAPEAQAVTKPNCTGLSMNP
jgi:UV DNA damage repair endonuclease